MPLVARPRTPPEQMLNIPVQAFARAKRVKGRLDNAERQRAFVSLVELVTKSSRMPGESQAAYLNRVLGMRGPIPLIRPPGLQAVQYEIKNLEDPDDISGPEYSKLRSSVILQGKQERGQNPQYIAMPNWDDVFKVRGKVKVTAEELKEHRDRLKEPLLLENLYSDEELFQRRRDLRPIPFKDLQLNIQEAQKLENIYSGEERADRKRILASGWPHEIDAENAKLKRRRKIRASEIRELFETKAMAEEKREAVLDEDARRRDEAKKHVVTNLSDKQLDYLEWKRRIYLQIKASPTPEIVRKIGFYLTWVDNLNDVAATASYLLELAAWGATKIFGRTPKGMGRGIGWISTVAQILDVYGHLRMIAGGKAATKRRGKQVVDNLLKKAKVKPKFLKPLEKILRKLGPAAARAPYVAWSGTKKLARQIPKLIPIGQTADWFTGYGLSIGPVVGLIQDSIFGTVRGARYKLFGKESKPAKKSEFLETPEELGELRDEMSYLDHDALFMWQSAAWASTIVDLLDDEDKAMVATMANLSSELWRESDAADSIVEAAGQTAGSELSPPTISPENKIFLEMMGEPEPPDETTWPLPGEPTHVKPEELAEQLQPMITGAWDRAFDKEPYSDTAAFCATALSDATKNIFEGIEGQEIEWEMDPPPLMRAINWLMDQDLFYKMPEDQEEARPVLERIADYYEENKSYPRKREVEEWIAKLPPSDNQV